MEISKKNQILSSFRNDEKFIHLNSTVVKDVSKNGGDVSAFVPPSVEKALFNKFFS